MTTERETTKRLILKLIQAYGGTLKGKTRLFKAYYYAHLAYWKLCQQMLTTSTIARMDGGPGIDGAAGILNELVDEGLIAIGSEESGMSRPTVVYSLKVEFPLDDDNLEDKAVKQAWEKTHRLPGGALSQKTHRDSRAWERGENGDIIDVYFDAADAEELDQLRAARKRAAERIAEALK